MQQDRALQGLCTPTDSAPIGSKPPGSRTLAAVNVRTGDVSDARAGDVHVQRAQPHPIRDSDRDEQAGQKLLELLQRRQRLRYVRSRQQRRNVVEQNR
jgi:hypothetical protein